MQTKTEEKQKHKKSQIRKFREKVLECIQWWLPKDIDSVSIFVSKPLDGAATHPASPTVPLQL